MNLVEIDGKTFQAVVDYYSIFIMVHPLPDNSASGLLVKILDRLFVYSEYPTLLVSDNGPQFMTRVFKDFLTRWTRGHITSSPRYPKAMEKPRGRYNDKGANELKP